jgi:hypothetical protein
MNGLEVVTQGLLSFPVGLGALKRRSSTVLPDSAVVSSRVLRRLMRSSRPGPFRASRECLAELACVRPG